MNGGFYGARAMTNMAKETNRAASTSRPVRTSTVEAAAASVDAVAHSADNVRTSTVATANAYYRLLQAQDWPNWIDLWAEDALLEFPFAPDRCPMSYRGRGEILKYMSGTAQSIVVEAVADLKISPMHDPERVVAELTINGHLREDGAAYNQRYVTFFEISHGRITHCREYWNPLISIDAHGGYKAWMRSIGRRDG
jgi:ketosteroid isomerase-like protein